MNRFVILDGLPFLYADGRAFAVRWDEAGFTVGEEVALTEAPSATYPELSIFAKCTDLDSIKAAEPKEECEEAAEDFDGMTLTELKKYAADHGVKLGSARTKDAIIAAIAENMN